MKKGVKKQYFLKESAREKVKNSLIPRPANDHKPHILRPKSLGSILVCLLAVKIVATMVAFFVYPDLALLSTDIYKKVVELTNNTRASEGVHELNENQYLIQAAKDKVNDMLTRQYFSHDTPEGRRPWQWINKSKYDYINAGENLAMNFTSAEVAHIALLKSPTHKKNIVNTKYKDIGIAVVAGEYDRKSTMIMVQMFGRKRGDYEDNAPISEPISETVSNENTQVKQEEKTISPVVVNTKLQKTEEPIKQVQPKIKQETKEDQQNTQILSSNIDESDKIAQKNNTSQKDKIINIERKNKTTGFIDADLNTPNISTMTSVDIDQVDFETISAKFMNKSQVIFSVLRYSNYILIVALLFLVVAFALNILIKIRIQNPTMILQSVLVMCVIAFLLFNKFHFSQDLATSIMIM